MPIQNVIDNEIMITETVRFKSHDKLRLAGEMLATAAQDFKDAKTDIDYIKCILLAGAVKNIAYPLVNEFGGKSNSEDRAELATFLVERSEGRIFTDEEKNKYRWEFIAFDNFIYNSLKHSGDNVKKILPSNDLTFEANLAEEAKELILDARDEFIRIPCSQNEINHFPNHLLDFLCSKWPD